MTTAVLTASAAARGPGSAEAAIPTRERDSRIDNVRFVLIVLVVLGHMLATMRAEPLIDGVYAWIYMFHMPAFVFLSGLVISSATIDQRGGRRVLTGLIAPLLIFGGLYEIWGTMLGTDTPSAGDPLDPYWLLWFLVALTMWRLSVPILRTLRWPVLTTLVGATALVVLTDLPGVMSLDRFIVLMPFFVAGLVLSPRSLRHLDSWTWRGIAAAILLASASAAAWASHLPKGFLTFDDGVGDAGRTALVDLPAFLGMYAIAAAMILAILVLVPNRRGMITTWGTRTIYVYLLHGFVIRAFRVSGLDAVLNNPAGWALVVAASVALAVALSSRVVIRWTQPLVEPRLTWLLRPDTDPSAGGSPTVPVTDPAAQPGETGRSPRASAEESVAANVAVRWSSSR